MKQVILYAARWLAMGLVLTLVMAWLAPIARGQAVQAKGCGPAPAMVRLLGARFREAPIAVGTVAREVGVLMILASKDGSWSAVIIKQGRACFLFNGVDWQAIGLRPGKAGGDE